MCLPAPQVDRFYTIWYPLLHFVNRQRHLVPDLPPLDLSPKINAQDAITLRDSLWEDDSLLAQFIAQNPARLSAQDLALAQSWKHRRPGNYFVFKYLKKHTIFIDDREPPVVYGIKGLFSPFEDLFGPYPPVLIKTVLLPFGDEIITDGLFNIYRVTFGGGVRGRLKGIYDDAKEIEAIVTSLLPDADQISTQAATEKIEKINARILTAFRKYLYASVQSEKIAERDLASVMAFAAEGREAPEPFSLRDFPEGELHSYLSDLPETARKQAITGFKRFVKFMEESGRLHPDVAYDLREMLKQ